MKRRCSGVLLSGALVLISLASCDQGSGADQVSADNADVADRSTDRRAATGDGQDRAVADRRDWPQFRGPGGAGSTDQAAPVKWSATQHVLWRTDLPGAGTSSPIVLGDRIFLTYHEGYGVGRDGGDMNALTRHVACYNRKNGKRIWVTPVKSVLPEQSYENRMHWHGYASSTPVADEQRVYAWFGKSGVFAFDHDGKQLWRADVGSQIHGWGSAASLVLHGDLVFVNACVESEALIALNKTTGKEVWRVNGIKESWNTPVLVDVPGGGRELVLAMFGQVMGLDPASGRKRWTCKGIEYYIVPSAVSHAGVVFYTGGRNYVAMAVRAGGKGDVSDTNVAWNVNHGSNVSSPVYHDGHVYWVHDRTGVAYCVNAKTGDVVYAQRLEGRHSEFYASALRAGDNLYYQDRGGTTFVVSAKPKFELRAVNTLDGGAGAFNATPAVSAGRLLVRSDRYLYCIGEK